MNELVVQVLTPTVVAAGVSAAALLGRELLTHTRRRSAAQGELGLEQHRVLLRQIELLWTENANLKHREAECERRYRDLERRCRELERTIDRLHRRLDRFGRMLSPAPPIRPHEPAGETGKSAGSRTPDPLPTKE